MNQLLESVDWTKVGSIVGSWWGVIGPVAWIALTGLWVTMRRQVIPAFMAGFNRARGGYNWLTTRVPSVPAKVSPLMETSLMLCQDGLKWKFDNKSCQEYPTLVHAKGTILKFKGTTMVGFILGGLDILSRLSKADRNTLATAASSCLEDLQIRMSV